MASNTEMRRLVLHAADKLAMIPGASHMEKIAHEDNNWATRRQAARDLAAFAASVSLAEQTLRMVAACLEDDEPLPSPTLDAVPFDGEHRQTLRHRNQGNWWTTCNCGWIGPERSGRFAAEDEWKAHAVEVGQPLSHEQAGASS